MEIEVELQLRKKIKYELEPFNTAHMFDRIIEDEACFYIEIYFSTGLTLTHKSIKELSDTSNLNTIIADAVLGYFEGKEEELKEIQHRFTNKPRKIEDTEIRYWTSGTTLCIGVIFPIPDEQRDITFADIRRKLITSKLVKE